MRQAANDVGLSLVVGPDGSPANRVEIDTVRIAMNGSDRIIIDPAIWRGKPVIRGSRVPVTTVVGSLAGGMSFEEIQREYDLSVDDIRAALRFASELVDQGSFHPLPVG